MSEKIEDAPLSMRDVFKEASPKDRTEYDQEPLLDDTKDNTDCSCLPEALGRWSSYLFTLLSKCHNA